MGTLSDTEVRLYYDPRVKLINMDVPLTEANAKIIHSLRNALKRLARDLMADRSGAADLDKKFPLMDFEYYKNKYYNEGYRGKALWKRIMEGGKTPNKNVSKKYGIE
jgi:hypothetical protein